MQTIQQRFLVLVILLCGSAIASCMTTPGLPVAVSLPTPFAVKGPAIPFRDPNILGKSESHIHPIADTPALLNCLAAGQTVYGIALQNSNVRVSPQTNACRVGRVPRGNLVRVTGAIDLRQPPSSNPVSVAVTLPVTATIGYAEDIQPIFKRTCIACHSAVVKTLGLQVTEYATLMAGSTRGPVVVPGNAAASKLWQLVSINKMPLIGHLADQDKQLIVDWINAGAPEHRKVNPPNATASATATTSENQLWLQINPEDMSSVTDQCNDKGDKSNRVISSELIFPLSCGVAPRPPELQATLQKLSITPATVASAAAPRPSGGAPAAAGVNKSAGSAAVSGGGGIQAAALNLSPPSDSDGWLQPRGGFCVEQRLVNNKRGITAMTFAPDGRLFLALDQDLTDEPDPLILYDAYHPSRSIAIYDVGNDKNGGEILTESTRITGMTYANGALFLNRAGEVGWIPDGGKYQPLAGGFAVNSQLFHANDGIAVVDGWLYVSAGGVHDGYSDGPIQGVGEQGAIDIVSGGNHYAARLVRAPLDQLISQHSITVFQTAARGLRNPYGLAVDPSGRLWFTDNGATNVPEHVSAGDEVNLFDPRTVSAGTAEDATPYFGFPLALTENPPDWYSKPVVALPNTSAPTGITWAYGTIFFGQYGRDPGLYRLGKAADGHVVAERIMVVWPLLAVTTAPDGALWVGTGSGGLFRITPGCG